MHNEDLLGGALSKKESTPADRVLQELSQLLSQRQTLFSSAIALCTIMFMVGICIAGVMIYMLDKNKDIHWHASLLVAAFVIPPTVIILALMRGVFKTATQDTDSTGVPTADLAKEIWKKGIEVATKVDKPPLS